MFMGFLQVSSQCEKNKKHPAVRNHSWKHAEFYRLTFNRRQRWTCLFQSAADMKYEIGLPALTHSLTHICKLHIFVEDAHCEFSFCSLILLSLSFISVMPLKHYHQQLLTPKFP